MENDTVASHSEDVLNVNELCNISLKFNVQTCVNTFNDVVAQEHVVLKSHDTPTSRQVGIAETDAGGCILKYYINDVLVPSNRCCCHGHMIRDGSQNPSGEWKCVAVT